MTLLFVGARPALALHPLITEDAYTIGAGTSQMELGIEHNRFKHDAGDERVNVLRPVYSYGILENIDLMLGLPLTQIREEAAGEREHRHGVADASLDLKWRFHEAEGTKVALKPGIILSNGDVDRGFGGGRVAAGAALVVTVERDGWNWNLHGGYLWNDNKVGDRRDMWHLSASVLIQIREGLQLALDASVDSHEDPLQDTWPSVLLGAVIYSPRKDLDIDIGVKAGLNSLADDYGVLAGITFRW
ncbi:MAG TPA: transporter [Burkholderiales bacterium]